MKWLLAKKTKQSITKSSKTKLNLVYRDKLLSFRLSSSSLLLTGKDVLWEKYLLEKAAAIKRFEYSPLGSDLKK